MDQVHFLLNYKCISTTAHSQPNDMDQVHFLLKYKCISTTAHSQPNDMDQVHCLLNYKCISTIAHSQPNGMDQVHFLLSYKCISTTAHSQPNDMDQVHFLLEYKCISITAHSQQPNDMDQVHFLLKYKCISITAHSQPMTWTRYTSYSNISAKTKGKDHSGWSVRYTIWFLWNAPYIKQEALREEQCLIDEQCLAVTTCFILRQPVLFYGTSTGSTLHAHSSQVALATCTLFSLLLNTACTFFPLRSRPLPCFFVRPALLLPFFQFLSFFPAWSLLSPLDLFSTL